MKKIYKVLSVFLSIMMVVSIIPVTAFAAPDPYSGTCGDNLTWSFDEATGTLTISGEGDMYDFPFDDSEWFDLKSEIVNVVIEDGVTSIGDSAFELFVNLKSITIPESVTAIGAYAFDECDSLTKIVLHDGITKIGDGAFSNCDYLDTVVIPGTVTDFGGDVFIDCDRLANVTLCDGLTDIGFRTFAYCTSLTDIVIPESVTSLNGSNFEGCVNLKSITFPASIKTVGYGTFGDCINLQDVYYTGTEEELLKFLPYGNNAPLLEANIHCESTVHRHNYVKTGECVAEFCDEEGYTTYTCECGHSYKGDYVKSTGHNYDNGVVTTNPTCTADGVKTFTCSKCGGTYTEAVTKTGHSYDDGVITKEPTCSSNGIKTFTCGSCGDKYTELVDKDSSHNYELVVNTSPSETECVKKYKCTNCGDTYSKSVGSSGHINVVVHEVAPTESTPGLTAGVVCSYCGGVFVKQEMIPALGTNNDPSVIVSGTCGTSVYWTYNKETYTLTISGTGAMNRYKSAQSAPWDGYKSEIKSIIIEEGVTTIGNYAFKNCTSLIYVSIPDTLTQFGSNAFLGCSSLRSVTMSDAVDTVTSSAFKNCTSLISVRLSNNISYIEDSLFEGCSSLIHVTVPDSVYYINANAFADCKKLKSVTIGANTIIVYANAFKNCNALTTVHYVGTEEEWNAISVVETGNAPLTSANIHYNSTNDNDVEGHKHNYTVTESKPSCTEAGYTRFVCDCGDEYIENYPAHGHTIITVAPLLPTTTEPGHTRHEKCSTCGEMYGGAIVPVLPNDQSYAAFQSSDDFIGVTDELASTFTIYGNGPIESDDGFSIKYYIDTVIFADGITGIGSMACYRWGAADTIIIGDSVKSIGADAFRECEYETIIIGDGVETIGNDAFWASCFESIEFGKSVKSIGTRIFYGCDDLKSVTIDSENPYITIDEQGIIYNKEKTKVIAAIDYFKTKDYVLADTVQDISTFAFYCNPSIESISLPDTLKSVGNYAFNSCDNLESVYYSGTEEQWKLVTIAGNNTSLLNSTFYFESDGIGGPCGNNAMWHLDESTGVLTVSGKGAMYDYVLFARCPWGDFKDSIKTVIISEGITSLGKGAFVNCDSLTTVILPNTLKTIVGFANCDNLVNITIPNSVTTIGDYAFSGCTKLTDIIIPYSVTSIGYEAFSKCESLTSITIPDTVTELKYGTFLDCVNLKTAIIGDGVSQIGGGMFRGCTNLEFVIIGDNVKTILGETFMFCKSLTSIIIPEGVTHIGMQTFWGCTALKTITIPATVTQMDDNVFSYCDSLTDVYYSGSEEQWQQIKAPDWVGVPLLNARKHYNSTEHTPKYLSVITLPTCTEQGYTTYTCICGNSYIDDYVDATGHSHTSKIITPATHTTTGIEKFTCACGDSYTEVIAKLEKHNYEAVVTPPTCTEQGYTTYTCDCGESYADNYVNATGHKYDNSVCTVCGNTQSFTGIKGDYFYKNGVRQKAYQLVEFDGNFYFINDSHKLAKNKRIYLSERFVNGFTFADGTPLKVGYYEFDADGKMILNNGVVGDYFYINGVRQNAYQLIEFEGNYYFINDSHKVAKNKRLYMSAKFVEGTDLKVGYYEFDADGKMILKNGPDGDYFYINGVRQNAYQLVEFEGNYYFINDSHKLAKNKRLYMSQRFVEGTDLKVGYYEFDADGKMIIE